MQPSPPASPGTFSLCHIEALSSVNTGSPSPSPVPGSHFLPLVLATLGTSYKFVFLWLAYFTQHNILKVYLCGSSVRIAFFRAEWLSTVCLDHIFLSIDLSVDTWVASTFWLLWIVLLWIWVYKYLFKALLSVLWVQADLWDITGSIPEHHNKVNFVIFKSYNGIDGPITLKNLRYPRQLTSALRTL